MRPAPFRLLLTAALFCTGLAAAAQDMMTDRFEGQPETRWRFFTDGVMGGVSMGQVSFVADASGGARHARLTGTVSTANNGGFLQMRRDLETPVPAQARGVRAVVRGNDQRYFVHLRTRGTVLPWQYYQAGFEAGPDWREIRLPFARFEPSGALLRATPRPDTITSTAIVAFGRDHVADIEIREIGFY